MKKIVLLLGLAIVPALAYSQMQFNREEELLKLARPDLLPVYSPGVVEEISSYDPTGGNEDGFAGKYSYIRKEGGKLVIADLKGPGVIDRIWTPTPTQDTLEFFFDGEKTARLKICFNDLFNGKQYPFVYPLCANAVGGYYCYFPFAYRESCKITFSGKKIMFHQIQYKNLDGYDVQTYTPELSAGEQAAVKEVCRVWSNINPSMTDYDKGDCTGAKVEEKTFIIKPGEEVRFFSTNKGGRICGLEIDGGDSFNGLYRDILLKAKWDGEQQYAINAPVADFFGYAFGKPSMRSILIGNAQGRNYSFFPAPFDSRAALSLKYEKRDGIKQPSAQITTRVYYNGNARNISREGKFYANWRREINPEKGKLFKFLHHSGKGHYVGTVQLAQGFKAEMTGFFEGDDSTYVDGAMRIHGTGSEDYYNGGWYAMLDRWDRGFSMPVHGCLDYSLPMSRTGGYRFYLSDKLSFEKEIYCGIEHGPVGSAYPVDYTSVAYFYSDTPSMEQMSPDEGLRETYIPRVHAFYPQAMRLSIGNNVQVRFGDYPRGIVCSSRGSGLIRVLLEDVPEGRYKVYVDYYENEKGAEFSVWHRQVLMHDWMSSEGVNDRKVGRFYCGDIVLTPQSNSVSFQIRGKNYSSTFEFANIYLERDE